MFASKHFSRLRGFTLLEITAMLAVIGIVSLLGYTQFVAGSNEARGKPAQLAVARVLAAQQVFASANGRYTPSATQLFNIGRDLTITTGSSTGSDVVSMVVSDADTLVLASYGGEGFCYVSVVSSLSAGAEVEDSVSDASCQAAGFLPSGETALPDTPV